MDSGPRDALTTAHILTVNHDQPVRETIQLFLAACGYTVKATNNSFHARRLLEAEPYDLLICDVKMPALDGALFYGAVLSRWPTSCPKVIFVSAVGESSGYDEGLKAVNVPVLFTPFTLPELIKLVTRVLQPVSRARAMAS